MNDRPEHWNAVYGRRAPTDVSWFQREATLSLAMMDESASTEMPVVDVGAGASLLVDGLLARGFRYITLLDVAENAFVETRKRLANVAPDTVHYVVSDVTRWVPIRTYAWWHDRAVFHFLTEERDRAAYREVLASALAPNGQAVIATFSLEGPERCSGLPVRRYSALSLAAEFNGLLRHVEHRTEVHTTPSGASQSFVFARFVRA